jgi:hypothetical protein
MPITPSLVYNSNLSPNSYTYGNAQTAYTTAHGASGYKLSICETLIKKSYITEDGATSYYYIWADGDGTEHYFMPSTTDATTYVDEDGLLLTLVEKTASNTCTITDSGKNIRTFNKCRSYPGGTLAAYYLSRITDKSGNAVAFTVDLFYRPTAVQLIPNGSSSIEQLRIIYTSFGLPLAVWNPASGDGVAFRYSSVSGAGQTYYVLQKVVHAHGSTAQADWETFYHSGAYMSTARITLDAIASYTYDENGRITSASNGMTQYEINYSYDTIGRVIAVSECAGSTGQQISLEYGTSSTIIRTSGSDDEFDNSDDLLTTYGFDAEGRAVSCYTTDLSRTQIYGTSSGQYVGEDNEKAKNKTNVVKKKRNGVKEAKLKYRLISYDQASDSSTLRVKLYTGRTHQIRVQMSFIGHCIHGDKKYGSDVSVKPMRLHSFLLSFDNPATNNKEIFTSIPDWIDAKSSEKLYSDTFC